MPLVQTMSSRYLHPNGSNVIVAIMCYSGYNQEDSLLINEGSVKKGLFNGSKFTFKKTSLDQKEEFGNPDINNTDDLSSASYDKLTDGLIAVGSIVNKGDALIGKSVRLNKTSSSDYNYSDKSIIYKNTEPAIVHDVIKDRNEDDEKFVKVLLRKPRSVSVGDKFSSRAGQKGVVGILLKEAEMPFTEDGMRPSIIMNPHSIPSRMTIGQLNESLAGNWCAAKGVHADATIFRKVDMDAISDELESMGMHRNGYRRLYNGTNGTAIDTLIFTGPTYYQRLHKFVIDQVYSVSHGPSDAKTLQPLDGKSSGGGLKIGEMEKDVLCSHGVSRFLSEKFFDHSDGYREYICRCGKAAVFNKRENIYKCVYCKDNADISKINTSWTAKLFKQELESMNIGVRTYPEPFTYETML
jgi:DNA-directed RNA polymerase II subunit RPB2